MAHYRVVPNFHVSVVAAFRYAMSNHSARYTADERAGRKTKHYAWQEHCRECCSCSTTNGNHGSFFRFTKSLAFLAHPPVCECPRVFARLLCIVGNRLLERKTFINHPCAAMRKLLMLVIRFGNNSIQNTINERFILCLCGILVARLMLIDAISNTRHTWNASQ